MVKFITHEPLERGLFNYEYCSGQGVLAPWNSELTNTCEILELVVMRLESDFQRLNPRMRKPYSAKDVETHMHIVLFLIFSDSSSFVCGAHALNFSQEQVQRSCAAYVACRAVFKQKYPSKFVESELPGIEKSRLVLMATVGMPRAPRFRFRHCDAELTTLLEDSVPPLDLCRVGAFRAAVQKYAKKARFT